MQKSFQIKSTILALPAFYRITYIMISLIVQGSLVAVGQTSNHPAKSEIIQAEINFAEQAKEKGIPYAFLHNLDSSGIIVSGNNIIKGISAYKKAATDSNELLSWRPAFCYINKENDFGFTSGPYLYYANRKNKAIAAGFYFSLWKKNASGDYKVLFDGGVNHTQISPELEKMISIDASKIYSYRGKKRSDSQLLVQKEEFESLDKNDEVAAMRKYAAKKSLMLRADEKLNTSYSEFIKNKTIKNRIGFSRREKGSGSDDHKSMYYSYGNLIQSGDEKYCGFYITVWEMQDEGWKIIADVVQFKPH